MLTDTHLSNYFSRRRFLNKRMYCAPPFSPSARKAHFLYPVRKGYCQNVQNPITCFLVPWSFSGAFRLFNTIFRSEEFTYLWTQTRFAKPHVWPGSGSVSRLLLVLGCCVTTEVETEGGLKYKFSWITSCHEVCVYLCFVLSLQGLEHIFGEFFCFSALFSRGRKRKKRWQQCHTLKYMWVMAQAHVKSDAALKHQKLLNFHGKLEALCIKHSHHALHF